MLTPNKEKKNKSYGYFKVLWVLVIFFFFLIKGHRKLKYSVSLQRLQILQFYWYYYLSKIT